jgi:acetolactate decarboxylase
LVTLTFGDSKSIMAELSRRAGNTMDVSMLVRERLAEYLFQVSSSGYLVQGVYSEAVTCAKTLEHGDFGLGTFTGLDGEMVVLEGHVYRVQGAGRVSQASVGDGAPLAIVTCFEPSIDVETTPVKSFAELAQQCDRHRRSDNLFYAIRLSGKFDHVPTRAVSTPESGGRATEFPK